MEEVTIRQAFLKLKPLCDCLMKEPTVRNAIDVEQCVKNLPKSVIQNLMEYILFPVIIHLQSNTSKDVKLHLIYIVREVIPKVRFYKLEFFNKLYICLIASIYDSTQNTLVIQSHEELKECVVDCLKYLIVNASMDVIEEFYTRDNAAKISQSVHTCLSIARNEKSSLLRVAALEALISLSYVHDGVDPAEVVLRNDVANIIMLFLPGIVKGLQEIYQGSDIQNHQVTMTAVRALGRIVALVMEDLTKNTEVSNLSTLSLALKSTSDPLGIQLNQEGRQGMEKHIKTVVRNQEWLDAAAEKLKAPMRDLMNLTKHSHYKVRKELAVAVILLITKCPVNLYRSFADLTEILITLTEDDVQEVRELANASLNQVNSMVTQYKMKSIVEVLEGRFYKLLTELPRIIRRSDDVTQLSYLNKLAGYLRLFGKERLPHVMAFIDYLRQLILALVYVAELDCSDVTILEENQLRTIEDTVDSRRSWKKFKLIRDSTTEDKLILICNLLSTLGDLSLLVDRIFDLMTDMPHYRKELILLLNWILKSTHNEHVSLHRQVVEYYTNPELWYLPTHGNYPLRKLQYNIVESCLVTEGLGIVASVLGKNYHQFLLKTLYLVIERAGSGHGVISLVGLQTLDHIANSQGNMSIADLIRDNVDYVSYHVTNKLRCVNKNPGVLNVVTVVMKYSTMDVLPCLKEIVEDTLAQLAANNEKSTVYSLLKVLYTFTVCLKQLLGISDRKSQKDQGNETNIAEKVIQELLEHHESKRVSEQLENDDLGGSPEDILKEIESKEYESTDYNEAEENKEPPMHVKIIESIMKQCLHFLPSKDTAQVLLTMQTLQEGLCILADWTDQLLPTVHEIWHPLVDRFQDSNVLIINRAWQLLYTLAYLSKDFIRTRALEQVSPGLAKFLDKSAKESYRKNSNNAYKFTQMFKVQRLLLMEMGQVARYLKLQEPDLWKLVTITEPYLNCYQHPELQECCVNLYKEIADLNGDIVWVKCISLWHSHVQPIPDTDFSIDKLEFEKLNDSGNIYVKNLKEIFRYLDDKTRSIDR
ncbi:TELO2-interacting protein 1 homolog [Microplitis demolitor]|uniref:TELO2-interacting protein 1 homolog n=1 Tax=Microplitis demolitor TaxID=69319 RepID=UPI0004CD89C3|nr:TELO2-interacting protein 1 homolog [Microplitis demolitor]